MAFCLLLLMFGCKAKKQLIVKQVAKDTSIKLVDSKRSKLDAIRAAQINFDTFSGKAHASLNIGGNSNDVTLNIRIKRDQKIWVSITAIAGIEVARAMITPDSLLVINRLQSVYLKKPFSYINKYAGNQVNYRTIESLLIGNAMPELINENSDLHFTADSITLNGTLNELVYKLMLNPGLKVTQTNLSDQSVGQSLTATNTVFIQSGTRVIPSQIDISSIVKDKKIQVNLRYIKADFDQKLEFPFSIPARYDEGK